MTYYRWKAFIKTGKLPSRQEMINWTDGKGNPLGKAYTRQQVTSMTEPYFERVKIEVWELRPCMLPIPLFGDRLSRKLPKRWLSVLSNYIGWYIYAICTKRS